MVPFAFLLVLFATGSLAGLGCQAPSQPAAKSCVIGGDAVRSWEQADPTPPPTRSALLANFAGGSPPGPATWIVPAGAHGASKKGNYLAPTDGVVTLHGIAATTRRGEEFRFVATALVDYLPSEATWRFWNAERTAVQREHHGTGVAFATSERVVVFDVEVRGVDARRAHELATYVELAPRGGADTSDADVRRWLLAARPGAPLPSVECVVSTPQPFDAAERKGRSRGLTGGLARIDGAGGAAPSALTQGSRVSVAVRAGEKGGETFAVVGLVDGVPAGRPQFVRAAAGAGDVAHRARFNIPHTPKVGFVAAVWRDPFGVEPDSPWTSNFTSTNFLPRHDGASQ